MSVFQEPEKRDTQLRIMLTKSEKERLDETAKTLEMSVSDLVRDAVNDFVNRATKKKRQKG